MSKELIEQYYHRHFDKTKAATMADFYAIYVAVEKYNDRTPVTYYKYRTAFYYYFNYMYRFIVRINWVFKLMYRLGTIRVMPINREKGWFKFMWKKGHRENTRFPNQEVYCFQNTFGNSNYGKKSLWVWLKETRKNAAINWYEVIDDI